MSDYRTPVPGPIPPDPDPDPERSPESRDSGLEPREPDLAPEESGLEPGESELAPEESGPEPREPELAPEESSFEPREAELAPEEPGFESREPDLAPEESSFEPREPELAPEESSFEPREPVFASESSSFEPRDSGLGAPDSAFEPRDSRSGSEGSGSWPEESTPAYEDAAPAAPDAGSGPVESVAESAAPEPGAPSSGGGVWARLRRLDRRRPRPPAQAPGATSEDAKSGMLARLAGLERRRVPAHVFMIDSGRLLYGRFAGDKPPLTLLEFHEQALPEGLWPDGPLGGPAREPAALAQAVAALVGAASQRPAEASLVVPDAWLRLAFTELEELPRAGEERDAVLRWKLKGLTPFRVDELRVEAAPMKKAGEAAVKAATKTDEEAEGDTDADAKGEPTHRVLIGFGVERLLSQLEEVFAGAGVRLGQLLSSGLALASLAGVLDRGGAITALAYVRPDGYGLAFEHRNDLLFHRVKLRGGDRDILGQVHRDLMLTRSYLEEHFPDLDLGALLLLAPESERFRWLQWLADGFDREPLALEPEDLPLAVRAEPSSWLDLAPMLGASLGEY